VVVASWAMGAVRPLSLVSGFNPGSGYSILILFAQAMEAKSFFHLVLLALMVAVVCNVNHALVKELVHATHEDQTTTYRTSLPVRIALDRRVQLMLLLGLMTWAVNDATTQPEIEVLYDLKNPKNRTYGLPFAYANALKYASDRGIRVRYITEDEAEHCTWFVSMTQKTGKYHCGGRRVQTMFPHADVLREKDTLWAAVSYSLGRQAASELTPESWLVTNRTEWRLFGEFAKAHPNQTIVLKSREHRQKGVHFIGAMEGLALVNARFKEVGSAENMNKTVDDRVHPYLLAQRLVEDVLTFNDYVISLRFWMSVVSEHDNLRIICYKNGKVNFGGKPIGSGNNSHVEADHHLIHLRPSDHLPGLPSLSSSLSLPLPFAPHLVPLPTSFSRVSARCKWLHKP